MSQAAEKEPDIFDYVPKVLPLLDFMFIVWIAFCSPQPWITTPINIGIPVAGLTTIYFFKNKGRLGFYIIGIVTSIPNFALNCWASPTCPTWLNEFAFITGGLLMAQSFSDRIVVFILVLTSTIVPLSINDNTLSYIITVVIAELALFFLIERSMKFMNAQHAVLERQKKVIEEKNKDITDSITYAQRIQQARLPVIEEIISALPESFVLFKPKDIVSGDFYFFHRENNSIFLAAADCTGHGVPGALMSMVGSEKLSEAIAMSNNPSEILSQLNRGIKTSLRQSGDEKSTRDGMDIALCVIQPDKRTVNYAGAFRPLWIVRKDALIVEEIKATKKAIGGLTEEHQFFETHTAQFNKSDSLYIFTDGYADTFNGKDGKKLTTKKFKELLLGIQHLNMVSQGEHLNTFIEEWKGGTEQIDDILVIGVRF